MAEPKTQVQGDGAPAKLPGEEEEWFDLIPAEKKLISWSLILGVILLVVLIYVSYYVIPIPH